MICVLCCNTRIHVITHISGQVCDVLCINASVLTNRKDLVRTNHPCLRVGRHNTESPLVKSYKGHHVSFCEHGERGVLWHTTGRELLRRHKTLVHEALHVTLYDLGRGLVLFHHG
jgi:hypothetical protein